MTTEMNKPDILITGAAGYLGYNLTQKLISMGCTPGLLLQDETVPDYLKALQAKVEIVETDCHEAGAVADAVKGYRFVYHTSTSGQVSSYHPAESKQSAEEMVAQTRNVFQACQLRGVEKAVYISSYAIGNTENAGNSGAEIRHLLPYLRGKAETEEMVIALSREMKFSISMVKTSMLLGPEDPFLTPTHRFLLELLKGKIRAIPRGGVNPVDVRDVVDGIVKVMEKGRNGHTYTLAGDKNFYIREFIGLINDLREIYIPETILSRKKAARLVSISDWFGRLRGRDAAFTNEMAADIIEHYAWFDNASSKRHLDWSPRPLTSTLEESIRFLETTYL
jgi:dihydroflavonol-4-reductase